MTKSPLITALNGCLERHDDGWYWCDGTPEPRVSDVTYAEAAPAWPILERDHGACVTIPHDFRSRITANAEPLINAVAELVDRYGQAAAIPAPELEHMTGVKGLQRKGWIVALEHWQRLLEQPHGAAWAIDDEADILRRAEALGYRRHTGS